MVFNSLTRIGIRQQPPTLDGAPPPWLARPSPASRERRAALTLGWKRGEVGADFCHLGMGRRQKSVKRIVGTVINILHRSPDSAQATPSPGSSEVSITQAATEDNLQDLPDLTHGESMSPPSTDQLHSMDGMCAQKRSTERAILRA